MVEGFTWEADMMYVCPHLFHSIPTLASGIYLLIVLCFRFMFILGY